MAVVGGMVAGVAAVRRAGRGGRAHDGRACGPRGSRHPSRRAAAGGAATPEGLGWPAAGPPDPERAPLVMPFAIGEELQYQVLWSAGGPASLPAGDAVFRVEQGPHRAPSGFRFELTMTTASWISAFFDARDRFWSLTGPDLAPITHVQELNEGRRHADADDDVRQQAAASSWWHRGLPTPSRTPWSFRGSAGVRDPLGAFYQARLDRDRARPRGCRCRSTTSAMPSRSC